MPVALTLAALTVAALTVAVLTLAAPTPEVLKLAVLMMLLSLPQIRGLCQQGNYE
jgi:hypothetical protein